MSMNVSLWVDDYGHFTETEAYGGIYYVFISDITEKRERMESDQKKYRKELNNMITGVSQGFTKKMEVIGVGYKAEAKGDHQLDMGLGYSHNILFDFPKEITVQTINEKGKNPIIILNCIDKQLLGMVATKIRSYRKPEPYKGKGIRFEGEYVRKKAGKSAEK